MTTTRLYNYVSTIVNGIADIHEQLPGYLLLHTGDNVISRTFYIFTYTTTYFNLNLSYKQEGWGLTLCQAYLLWLKSVSPSDLESQFTTHELMELFRAEYEDT